MFTYAVSQNQIGSGLVSYNLIRAVCGRTELGRLRTSRTWSSDSCTPACFRNRCAWPKPDRAIQIGSGTDALGQNLTGLSRSDPEQMRLAKTWPGYPDRFRNRCAWPKPDRAIQIGSGTDALGQNLTGLSRSVPEQMRLAKTWPGYPDRFRNRCAWPKPDRAIQIGSGPVLHNMIQTLFAKKKKKKKKKKEEEKTRTGSDAGSRIRHIYDPPRFWLHEGTGIAQWLERRTRDWKVAGSNPCWNGGRIFFYRVDFLCWPLFRYPFHPRVTAVARKKSRSFCQKCRWQVTAKTRIHLTYVAFIEPCFGIGHNLSLICQMTSEDIKHQLIIWLHAGRNGHNWL